MPNLWEIRKNPSTRILSPILFVLFARKGIRNFVFDFCRQLILFRFYANIKLTTALLLFLFLIRTYCFLRVKPTSPIPTIST